MDNFTWRINEKTGRKWLKLTLNIYSHVQFKAGVNAVDHNVQLNVLKIFKWAYISSEKSPIKEWKLWGSKTKGKTKGNKSETFYNKMIIIK